jgi:DNA-binding transcriptional LysR family regulator
MLSESSAVSGMTQLRVAFDAHIPHARWGPLFHVFCLEQPGVRLAWRSVGFPVHGRSLLDAADVGVFLHPPPEDGLGALTLDVSPMVVLMAAGHRLARDGLNVADVLDEPFPGAPNLDSAWTAFWTLDEQRGGPARRTDDDVASVAEALEVVAAGRAIATVPAWVASGLAHPGVVSLALRDGPPVSTRLLWRADEDNQLVRGLIDLALAWTRRDGPAAGAADIGSP